MAYRWTMVLYLKRCAKVSFCESLYFLTSDWTRHSASLGGFFAPPPKNTSYSTLRRRTASSSRLSSSSTVTGAPRSATAARIDIQRHGLYQESRGGPTEREVLSPSSSRRGSKPCAHASTSHVAGPKTQGEYAG